MHSRQYLSDVINTIYIGGGTPTSVPTFLLFKMMEGFFSTLKLADKAEITIEANPDTMDLKTMKDLQSMGFNRISLGVQSLNNQELKNLGRIHDARRAQQTIEELLSLDFANISADLMLNLPGQTEKTWRESIGRLLEYPIQHLSIYDLSIGDDPKNKQWYRQIKSLLPDEATQARLDEIKKEKTEEHGFSHYEISNYAKPSFESQHNQVYWNNLAYVAIGLGATSRFAGWRIQNTKDMQKFLTQDTDLVKAADTCESVDLQMEMQEFMFLGLRMTKGVSIEVFAERYQQDVFKIFSEPIAALKDKELVIIENKHIRLNDKGQDFSNQAMSLFV